MNFTQTLPRMRFLSPLVLTVLTLAVTVAGCTAREDYSTVSGSRDFGAHPAIEQVALQPAKLFAISDVHGGYQRMISLLVKHGLMASVPKTPKDAVWSGGDAVFVVVGDLIDKGDCGLEVIDALMALETSAAANGGRVIVLMGNHEAEFLADPENSKATVFDDELAAAGLTPLAIASGKDPRGVWLRNRPFGVRLGNWFFVHSGNTACRTIEALEVAIETGLKANDYADNEIIGTDSILESRAWYSADKTIGSQYTKALGVEHIVFGHDPHALGPSGVISTGQSNTLVRIDCGMSPAVDDSQGALLRVTMSGGVEKVDTLLADGTIKSLF
jgi:hypothetical protein